MTADVHLQYVNAAYGRVACEPAILREMYDEFAHFAPNYKWSPLYRNKIWDGKIRFINLSTRLFYAGLAKRIKKFCDERHYTFSFDKEYAYDEVSEYELKQFIKSLNLPHTERDYQVDSVLKCLRSRRRLILSPTSSGKSLLMYIIHRWYECKSLIIVPTSGLVAQLESDFRSYGYTGKIHTSLEKLNKSGNIDADVVITTWQSLDNGQNKTKVNKAFYNQFDVVMGDEAHGCKASTLINILSKMENTPYRFGLTGTLNDTVSEHLTIEGLFGPQYRSISTSEMIEKGYAAKLQIKCIILKYPEGVTEEFYKNNKTYADEIDYIIHYDKRNNYIKNLALSLDKNKLVFFRLKEHGDILYKLLEGKQEDIFYIDGDIKAKDREIIRQAIEQKEDAILLASLGTTAQGVSINKLHHMIAAAPSKSKIKVLQSIGRMLRLHEDKEESGAILYDIVDDISYKSKKNYTLRHFEERIKIYDSEGFPYKIYIVGLK